MCVCVIWNPNNLLGVRGGGGGVHNGWPTPPKNQEQVTWVCCFFLSPWSTYLWFSKENQRDCRSHVLKRDTACHPPSQAHPRELLSSLGAAFPRQPSHCRASQPRSEGDGPGNEPRPKPRSLPRPKRKLTFDWQKSERCQTTTREHMAMRF